MGHVDGIRSGEFMKATVQRASRGVTLVEMMIVVAVIALLISALAVGFSTSFIGAELSGASRRLAAELEHGVQMAEVQNRTVTVRFSSDPNRPDEEFRGFQFGVTDPVTGVFKPTSKFHRFPASVGIHRSERTSTVLSLSRSTANFEFHFYADGSTSLPKDGHWCITLVRAELAWRQDLPSNYRTVVINPFNGSTTLY